MEAPDQNVRRSMSQALNETQLRGLNNYLLTRRQVMAPNFGEHTLDGIDFLREQDNTRTVREAFSMVSGLNEAQVEGVTLNRLNRLQVTSDNFGEHTNNAIHILTTRGIAADTNAAFQMIRGLDPAQIRGVTNFNFTPDQVNVENFGNHTLLGVAYLNNEGLAETNNEALEQVSGLTEVQVNGITRYDLYPHQVRNPRFDQAFINTMDILDGLRPQQSSSDLFTTVLSFNDYQIRGLGELNLSLEQVGLTTGEDGVEFITQGPYQQVDGATIDVTAFLMDTQSMSSNEAFRVALQLDQRQSMGVTDYGLTVEQVQTPFFVENANAILQSIVGSLTEEDDIAELPLKPEQYADAREAFENLKASGINQLTTAEDIQVTEDKLTAAMAAVSGVAVAPASAEQTQRLTTADEHIFAAFSEPVLGDNLQRSVADTGLDERKRAAKKQKVSQNDTSKKPGRGKKR